MQHIILKNIRVGANHACLAEEGVRGSDYRVDVKVKVPLEKAIKSDLLADTVDYVHLNRIVKEEMAIRSELLEHVAGRIIDRIFKELSEVQKITLEIAKINPPINGDVASVSVKIKQQKLANKKKGSNFAR